MQNTNGKVTYAKLKENKIAAQPLRTTTDFEEPQNRKKILFSPFGGWLREKFSEIYSNLKQDNNLVTERRLNHVRVRSRWKRKKTTFLIYFDSIHYLPTYSPQIHQFKSAPFFRHFYQPLPWLMNIIAGLRQNLTSRKTRGI